MKVQPYLTFEGRCDEALDFYREALGAEVTCLMRFKDSPDPDACGPNIPGDKVMHPSFRVGETDLFASDGRCQGKPSFQGITLSLKVGDRVKVEGFDGRAANTYRMNAKSIVLPDGRSLFSGSADDGR